MIKFKNEHEMKIATANRMRNKATQALSIELKRMPTEEEITMRVCKWLALAYEAPVYKDEPDEEDLRRDYNEQYGKREDEDV